MKDSTPGTGRFAALAAALVLTLAMTLAAPAAAQDRVITGDHTVPEGEVVSDIAVVGGNLTIDGEVTGEAVVVGGNLIMQPSGVVRGNATVTGGSIVQEGGRIEGEMKTLDGQIADAAGAAAAAVAAEAMTDADEARSAAAERRAQAREIEREIRRDIAVQRRGSSWFDPVRRGFADLISTLAFGLVLAGIGAVLVFYGRPYLETVSDTLRTSTVRSAAVGLAAGFLVVPAFVVMVVALAVSIIGIPVLLIAVPLYPLAIFAAGALGLLGAAHAIGERTSEQQRPSFTRGMANSYSYLFTGIAMILTPLILASFIEMTGFLDFLGTILKVVTWAAIWAVTTAGFGAVILSRAGTRRAFATPPMDPTLESDPLFDDENSRTPYP